MLSTNHKDLELEYIPNLFMLQNRMIFGHIEVLKKGVKLTLDQIIDCQNLDWDELEFVFESFEFCELEELSYILGISVEELQSIYPKIRSWHDLIFKYGFLVKQQVTQETVKTVASKTNKETL